MGAYPWGETNPSQTAYNLPGDGRIVDGIDWSKQNLADVGYTVPQD